MGVSFHALILDVKEASKTVVVTPLEEASAVCIETDCNLPFLARLTPYTLVSVEGTAWDLQKKRFVGGEIKIFNVDYDNGFEAS